MPYWDHTKRLAGSQVHLCDPRALIAFALLVSAILGLPLRSAHALSLEVGLNFTGGRYQDSFFIPPDSMGAVGEEHIVEFLNGYYAVYRKSDGERIQVLDPYQFWLEAGVDPIQFPFDPRVVYDPFSERWYAVEADAQNRPNNFLFAVSRSSDPTAGWTGFAIDSDSTDRRWADFPMLGFNADGVFLSANMFLPEGVGDPTGGLGLLTTVIVLPKEDLLGPTPTVANATRFENLPLSQLAFTPQMTVNLDGTAVPSPIVSDTFIPGVVQIASIVGPATAPSLDGLAADGLLLVPPFGGLPPDADQPGTSQDLDVSTFGNRFPANLVLRNGTLWGARMVDHEGRIAIQWFQFDPDINIVLQSGLVADDELDLFYPSIAVNEFDQVVMGFSGSSANQYASAYAVLGETVGGVTSFGELVLLKEGIDEYERVYQGRNRWGDYSATVVDPSDPRVFWTFQEWADSNDRWATQITQLIVAPEPGAAALVLVALGLAAWRDQRGSGHARGSCGEAGP